MLLVPQSNAFTGSQFCSEAFGWPQPFPVFSAGFGQAGSTAVSSGCVTGGSLGTQLAPRESN